MDGWGYLRKGTYVVLLHYTYLVDTVRLGSSYLPTWIDSPPPPVRRTIILPCLDPKSNGPPAHFALPNLT